MGMAAGQARLLSITSRLSDNELRAQMINNDKMRLATQSSRVSENYVNALNEAQLMFTNYDADNNTTYQHLTFNSLTAYNPYNNQYGLINSSGNILVSEKDADNFKKADGSVEEFLRFYGLEYTTTYFDNLLNANGEPVGYNSSDIIFYSIGNTTEDGQLLVDQPSGYNAAALEAMYRGDDSSIMNGGVTVDNIGYSQILQEGYYGQFNSLLDNYNEKYDTYLSFIAGAMDEKLKQLFQTTFGKDIDEVKTEMQSQTNTDTLRGYLTNLGTVISATKQYAYKNGENGDKADEWYKSLESSIYEAKKPTQDETFSKNEYEIISDGTDFYIATVDASGNPDEVVYKIDKNGSVYGPDDEGNFNVPVTMNGSLSMSLASADTSKEIDSSQLLGDDDDGTTTYYDVSGVTKSDITIKTPTTPEDIISAFNSVLSSLTSSIYSYWDATLDDWKTLTPEAQAAYDAYEKAAEELGRFIYGDGYSNGGSYPPYEELGNINELYNKIGESGYPQFDQENNHMYSVMQALILDAVMNTYGEPYYTWIDTSSRTESYNVNGEAKAEWYQNLFDRMQQGYNVILDGLASSEEWIQFAFESGIVTMEQVDGKNNWNSLIYTNCSDITEQTNDALIAKAEAEYKSAMNKIENKDKRYDLELKNIDTEHNSLQTEYDSIKAAIDKNIERTFKLYG